MHEQQVPFRGWPTICPVTPWEWSLSLKQWGCVVSAIRVPKKEEEDWWGRGRTVPESVVWKQLRPEGADPRNVWFFPNFFSAHFNKTLTLTRIIIQPRAAYFAGLIKYQHSNPGSRELTGNSWPEAYFLKIPNNLSDPELYYKTESNQICRLVAYFLSCEQICVSLEFFPLPSKPSKSKFLAFGFFFTKLSASKT